MPKKNKIIVICGPTASGKTYASVGLAEILNGEIISADSAQIYKELNIGTAKPNEKEMRGIKHHLIDIVPISQAGSYSVADYVKQAGECAENIIQAKKIPIVCGGTGLYIDHFIYNTKFTEYPGDENYRKKLAELSNEELYFMLKSADSKSAENIHMNNRRRIIRALEIFYITGKTKSELDEASRIEDSAYDFIKLGLRCEDREFLYERINRRTDEMIAAGLCDEVEELYKNGRREDMLKAGAIGYTELIEYFDGNCRLTDAIEKVKQNTRNYAKRQITWFKRDTNTLWIDVERKNINNPQIIIKNCIKYVNKC